MRTSLTLTALGCLLVLSFFQAEAAPSRPNIIVILSDDMGFSDIDCYGGEIQTPNLDALAKGGLRFTQFYNMARCCPTRASLLTGLYPHQAGVGYMMEDRGLDGYRGSLSRNCVTIAEALKPAGYRSCIVGKWHVTPGQSAQALAVTNNWPMQRGFDRYYGTIHGAGSFWDPSSLVRDGRWKLVSQENKPWELYDMERDRTELHDLADAEPSKVRQLAAKWDAYAARANVLPHGAWRGKGATTAAAKPNVVLIMADEQPEILKEMQALARKRLSHIHASEIALGGATGNEPL